MFTFTRLKINKTKKTRKERFSIVSKHRALKVPWNSRKNTRIKFTISMNCQVDIIGAISRQQIILYISWRWYNRHVLSHDHHNSSFIADALKNIICSYSIRKILMIFLIFFSFFLLQKTSECSVNSIRFPAIPA